MNGAKISGIRQIVRLGQMVKKWHTMALNRKVHTSNSCALSPTSNRRRVFSTMCDSDEECCRRPAAPPADVPEGYLAVYVGRERQRFVVPTCYLIRPVFRTLLQMAEEEFGFDHKGGLTIPCDISLFEHVLRSLGRNNEEMISLDEMVNCSNCDGAGANSNFGSTGFAA